MAFTLRISLRLMEKVYVSSSITILDTKIAFTKAPKSTAADIELALDAAHLAAPEWGKTPAAHRSNLLNKIADKIEANLSYLALVETVENGKPIRETMAADLPLVVDHFRYFAGVIRAEEGSIAEIDDKLVSICLHEPLGVVAQIIPWNAPVIRIIYRFDIYFDANRFYLLLIYFNSS